MRKSSSPYNGALTREQFLFPEMKITAKLLCEGHSEEDIIEVNTKVLQGLAALDGSYNPFKNIINISEE